MLEPRVLEQRISGLCERPCPERATRIVSPWIKPTAARRYCKKHGEVYRRDPAYHVARMHV